MAGARRPSEANACAGRSRIPRLWLPLHRELLARRFRMPIEDADLRRAVAELREERIDRAERIVLIGHEDAPDRVDDERTFLDDPAFAGIPRREVQRPDAVLERVDL